MLMATTLIPSQLPYSPQDSIKTLEQKSGLHRAGSGLKKINFSFLAFRRAVQIKIKLESQLRRSQVDKGVA